MNSRWTWLLAGLLCSSSASSSARAEPAPGPMADPVTSLLEVPAAIPAGGVLPMYGACDDLPACSNLRNLIVAEFGTEERVVPGHFELVHPDFNDAWGYFVPDVPFVAGSMLGASNFGNPLEQGAAYWVEVVEPTALSGASLAIEVQLSKLREVARAECCPSFQFMRQRCLDTEADTNASLFVGLSPVEAVATQYGFELTLRDVRSTEPANQFAFRPLTSTGLRSLAATFDGEASSYCYAVRALPLAGGTAIDLDEGCVDNDLTGLGSITRTPHEIEQWLATCEAPPPDVGNDGDDEGDDHDEPSRAGDAGVGATATDASDAADARRASGCQLVAASSPGSGAATSALLALLLLWSCRRRHSPLRTRAEGPRAATGSGHGGSRAGAVALVVCLVWCSSAQAIGAIGTGLTNVVPQVPSDGVLVLYGYCEDDCMWPRTVTVTDVETGARVAGELSPPHLENGLSRVTFRPEVAPRVGANYLVEAPIERGSGPAFTVHIIEPTRFDLTALRVDFSIRASRAALATQCCPKIFDVRAPRCFDTSVFVRALVELRVSSQHPVAEQWLYELTSRELGEQPFAGDFAGSTLLNLSEQSGWSTPFDGSASSYCYQVRAAPMAGGEVTVLDDACLVNDLREVGGASRSPAEIASFLDTCEKPPAGESGSPAGTDSGVGGDAGRARSDASGSTPSDDAGQGNWSRSAGCQLVGAQTVAASGLWSVLLALLVARRRSRTREQTGRCDGHAD